MKLGTVLRLRDFWHIRAFQAPDLERCKLSAPGRRSVTHPHCLGSVNFCSTLLRSIHNVVKSVFEVTKLVRNFVGVAVGLLQDSAMRPLRKLDTSNISKVLDEAAASIVCRDIGVLLISAVEVIGEAIQCSGGELREGICIKDVCQFMDDDPKFKAARRVRS